MNKKIVLTIYFYFRSVQRLTLTEATQLAETLEDIHNLITSRQQVSIHTNSSSLPPTAATMMTPSPDSDSSSFLSSTSAAALINSSKRSSSSFSNESSNAILHSSTTGYYRNQPMFFSTPEKSSADVDLGEPSKAGRSADFAAKNIMLADFVTPTKVLDVSELSTD